MLMLIIMLMYSVVFRKIFMFLLFIATWASLYFLKSRNFAEIYRRSYWLIISRDFHRSLCLRGICGTLLPWLQRVGVNGEYACQVTFYARWWEFRWNIASWVGENKPVVREDSHTPMHVQCTKYSNSYI